jgi:hypothetical protein
VGQIGLLDMDETLACRVGHEDASARANFLRRCSFIANETKKFLKAQT